MLGSRATKQNNTRLLSYTSRIHYKLVFILILISFSISIPTALHKPSLNIPIATPASKASQQRHPALAFKRNQKIAVKDDQATAMKRINMSTKLKHAVLSITGAAVDEPEIEVVKFTSSTLSASSCSFVDTSVNPPLSLDDSGQTVMASEQHTPN
jgi:hypothetical protein